MHEQHTDGWFQDRCGRVTASRIADMMAKTKTGASASRQNYAAQLVAERLTGTVEAGFTSAAMQHGTETEPQARAMYQLETGSDVQETGFHPHPELMAGASPDGLVGDDGLLEIKCPNTATHIATLIGGAIQRKYLLQMQFQMACTGRQWCDFVSFDPRMPADMQLFIKRVERDDLLIREIEEEASAFLDEVAQTVATLEAEYRKDDF